MKFENIYKLRKQNKKSQKQIANVLNLSQQSYRRYELEDVDITLGHLKKLADYYKVSIDYLLNHETIGQITLPPINNIQKEIIQIILSLDNDSLFNLYGYSKALLMGQ